MSADDPQIINELGFLIEATEDTDPIGIAGTFYQFGRYMANFGNFPEVETTEIALYKGSDYDPYKIIVAGTEVKLSIGFTVVNGVPLFMMLGRNETAPAGTYDGGVSPFGYIYSITPIKNGDQGSYTVRWSTSNGTDKIQKSVTGIKFYSLTLTLDLLATRSPLQASMTAKGKFMQPVVTGSESSYTYVLPSNIDKLYYPDSNMVFNVNGVDLVDYLEFISITIDTLNRLDGDKANHQPTENMTGDRIVMVTFRLRRSDETSVFDAYMAQAGGKGPAANVLSDIEFWIYNEDQSGTLIFQFYNIVIKNLRMNDTNLKKGERPYYEIICRATTHEYTIDDGTTIYPLYGLITP